MSQAKVITEREHRKILLHIAANKHASRNKAMFLTTHLSGMRVGEVAALKISDVLAADGVIKDEVYLLADQTKGDKGRTVLLPKRLRDELASYLSAKFCTRDLKSINDTDTSYALFANQKNPRRGFTANTLCQYFHHMYKSAGVVGCSSHSGRRGFITSLANQGVSVRILMELAGHKSMAVTQRYIDLNPTMMRNAVELMN